MAGEPGHIRRWRDCLPASRPELLETGQRHVFPANPIRRSANRDPERPRAPSRAWPRTGKKRRASCSAERHERERVADIIRDKPGVLATLCRPVPRLKSAMTSGVIAPKNFGANAVEELHANVEQRTSGQHGEPDQRARVRSVPGTILRSGQDQLRPGSQAALGRCWRRGVVLAAARLDRIMRRGHTLFQPLSFS